MRFSMKKFRQEHKILFGLIIFSLLIAIIFSFSSILLFFDDDSIEPSKILNYILIPLLPVLLTALISFAGAKTFTKHPKTTKIITGILTALVIFLQTLIYFVVFCFNCAFHEKNYDKLQNYSKALNSIHAPICIKHFPQEIPKNAKNIKMKKSENAWFGSEEILLKFDIDKKYIEDELKKYKFSYIENAKQTKHAFAQYILNKADIPRDKETNFTFYIINDRESETPHQNSFPYHYGIITNDNKTTVIYYYISPD